MHRIHAKSVNAAIEPKARNLEKGLNDAWICVIEVRLALQEIV
jgi:hypothetical protein